MSSHATNSSLRSKRRKKPTIDEKIDQGANSINTSILSNVEDGNLAPDQEEDNLARKILEKKLSAS